MDNSFGQIDKDGRKDVLVLPKGKDYFHSSDHFSSHVALFLTGLGLEKYIELFEAENIGVDVMKGISTEDLIAIGVKDENDIERIVNMFNDNNWDVPEELPLTVQEDVEILKGLAEQTKRLGFIFKELLKNLEKMEKKPIDERLTPLYSQLQVVQIILNEAIAQTARNLNNIFDVDEKGLITDIVERENIKLPNFLKNKLKNNWKIKKLGVLITIASSLAIGFFLKRVIMTSN